MWYLCEDLEGQVCRENYYIPLSYRPWCQNMVGRDRQLTCLPPPFPWPVLTANTFASSWTGTLSTRPHAVHNCAVLWQSGVIGWA